MSLDTENPTESAPLPKNESEPTQPANIADVVENVKESKKTKKESAAKASQVEPPKNNIRFSFNENRIFGTNFKNGAGWYRLFVKTRLGDKNKLIYISHLDKVLIPNDFEGLKAESIIKVTVKEGKEVPFSVVEPSEEVSEYLSPENKIAFAAKKCCGG